MKRKMFGFGVALTGMFAASSAYAGTIARVPEFFVASSGQHVGVIAQAQRDASPAGIQTLTNGAIGALSQQAVLVVHIPSEGKAAVPLPHGGFRMPDSARAAVLGTRTEIYDGEVSLSNGKGWSLYTRRSEQYFEKAWPGALGALQAVRSFEKLFDGNQGELIMSVKGSESEVWHFDRATRRLQKRPLSSF